MRVTFDFYKNINGTAYAFGLGERYDDSKNSRLTRVVYKVWLTLDDSDAEIIVPEEKNGFPIDMVSILYDTKTGDKLAEDKRPAIKRLYIPKNVRYINIPTWTFVVDYKNAIWIGREETSITIIDEIHKQTPPAPLRTSMFTLNDDDEEEEKYIPDKTKNLKVFERYSLLNGCAVEISPDNPYMCVYKNGIYSRDMGRLTYIFTSPGSVDECFEVPDSVWMIGSGAGSGIRGIKRVVIPENVKLVVGFAFSGCADLEEADINAAILGKEAFSHCRKLSAVKLTRCTDIGVEAFRGCWSFENIRLPDTLRKIGDYAFAYTKMRRLTVPSVVEEVGDYILRNDEPGNTFLELYIKDDAFTFRHKNFFSSYKERMVLRSAETNEILTELYYGYAFSIFKDQRIDFEHYDQMVIHRNTVRAPGVSKLDREIDVSGMILRFKYPYRMKSEYKEQIIDCIIGRIIENEEPDMALIREIPKDRLPSVIKKSTLSGKTELTAILLQRLHDLKNSDNDNK